MDRKESPRKQRQLGPAPIASFEDPMDEVKQNMDASAIAELQQLEKPRRLERSARVQTTAGDNLKIHTPSTPRIDISRASSSSHQDSRDSSPENVFDHVGTGTLQDASLGFKEDGTKDLRSSTEELHFMDKNDEKSEIKSAGRKSKSPIMFKFDDQHVAACLVQNQRKDSASSEVAALLCISGRTSRISSVGSQGSAVSRLSAVSGVSRSPSPHRMLLETSFCGPKPANDVSNHGVLPEGTSEIEQIIMSRKPDPTKAVFAEGITILAKESPRKIEKEKQIGNGCEKKDESKDKFENARRLIEQKLTAHKTETREKTPPKVVGSIPKKDKSSILPVVGKTPSGVEYIRINLKPDHLYTDHGVAPNERVLDVPLAEVISKPATLSLGHKLTPRASPQHLNVNDEISRHPDQRHTPNASPKPGKKGGFLRELGSRSPSPANVSVSRKSSFCSLFKSKEAVVSPESPSTQRKKSGISILLNEGQSDRSRSRSKSRESDRGDNSTNVTPNKQKNVLGIFKTKKSTSKSNKSSPSSPAISDTPRSYVPPPIPPPLNKVKLKYYENTPDGKPIHIPLHTPPEEKEMKQFVAHKKPQIIDKSENSSPDLRKPLAVKPEQFVINNEMLAAALQKRDKSKVLAEVFIHDSPKSSPKPIIEPKPKPLKHQNTDGSIRIPLRSPSEERDVERESMWSIEAQRDSSQDSQDTVISNSASQQSDKNIIESNRKLSESISQEMKLPEPVENKKNFITVDEQMDENELPEKEDTVLTKEKKRILFSTKIGSGSQEQVFSTQFSVSKTESLCSQLSEQKSDIESPNEQEARDIKKVDSIQEEPLDIVSSMPTNNIETIKRTNVSTAANSKRHSKYIGNVSEILNRLDSSDREDYNDILKEASKQVNIIPLEPEIIERKTETTAQQSMLTTKSSVESTSSKSDIQERSISQSSEILSQKTERSIKKESRQFMEANDSSESDTGLESSKIKCHLPAEIHALEDHESTGLVSQESFDDELPYVPTTLPEERSLGVQIIPSKERSNMELKMYPVDRPRATTPLNPANLEEYCGTPSPTESNRTPIRGEKLRISLPKKMSKETTEKFKLPRRSSNSSSKSWFEFAEQGIGGVVSVQQQPPSCTKPKPIKSTDDVEMPPPLPPRRSSNSSNQWIDFESLPEKRKPPKRITTLPSKDSSERRSSDEKHHYNYVNPEECQCECHETDREKNSCTHNDDIPLPEEALPLLDKDSGSEIYRSSDSSSDCSERIIQEEIHHQSHHYCHNEKKFTRKESKPFERDLNIHQSKSNRSSISSEDYPPSP